MLPIFTRLMCIFVIGIVRSFMNTRITLVMCYMHCSNGSITCLLYPQVHQSLHEFNGRYLIVVHTTTSVTAALKSGLKACVLTVNWYTTKLGNILYVNNTAGQRSKCCSWKSYIAKSYHID